MVRDYAELQNVWAHRRAVMAPMKPRQRVTGRYQLAVGPWFHDPTGMGRRYQELMLAWFDRWLKDEPTGIANPRTPLHLFELGPNRWVDQSRFPLPGARVQKLFLDGGGKLGAAKPRSAGTPDKLALDRRDESRATATSTSGTQGSETSPSRSPASRGCPPA